MEGAWIPLGILESKRSFRLVFKYRLVTPSLRSVPCGGGFFEIHIQRTLDADAWLQAMLLL